MLPLFAATIFLAAALLFIVEPMAAKLILPLLGGSPAVWNTCMVFFQGALLAGYLGAHILGKLRTRTQSGLYLPLLCAPLLLTLFTHRLIIASPGELAEPTSTSPISWTLLALAFMVGAPFLLLSAAAPLLQRWFSATSHRSARDPYFLYAASNAGSMLGLLGYPLFVEPWFTLSGQRRAWSLAYGILAVLIALCGVAARRSDKQMWRSGDSEIKSHFSSPDPPITLSTLPPRWRTRALWLLLALIPSSLTLGVTQYLSTDIAAVPLLWVIPLALYLLTFIIAFSRRPIPLAVQSRLIPMLILGVAVATLLNARTPAWALILLHLVNFVLCALLCHTRLAALRPHPDHLTEFYLVIALGGVLGGMFNTLLAPLLFTSIVEYPLAMVAALLARSPAEPESRIIARARLAMPIIIGLIVLGAEPLCNRLGIRSAVAVRSLAVGIPALLAYLVSRRPVIFALAVGAMFAAGIHLSNAALGDLARVRTFFGLYRLSRTDDFTSLVHSTTTHGVQARNPALAHLPLAYYSMESPIGQVFRSFSSTPLFDRIDLVGLGVGTLAAYGRTGQTITFHEIDPAVVRIAENPAYFTFLERCKAHYSIALGDGRLTLAHQPDAAAGLILLDAFSSDAIPIHLITEEAVGLYLTKLAPRGLLVFHISNHFLNLSPVLARIADDLHLVMLMRNDTAALDRDMQRRTALGIYDSIWVVLVRDRADLGPLLSDPRWQTPPLDPRAPLWTDDYSNILSIFEWH